MIKESVDLKRGQYTIQIETQREKQVKNKLNMCCKRYGELKNYLGNVRLGWPEERKEKGKKNIFLKKDYI